MKKLLLFVLLVLCIYLGYSFAKDKFLKNQSQSSQPTPKTPILKFALVADSEDKNDLLAKALNQTKNAGASFVIGLGDWTDIGTVDQLTAAKKAFDTSGLQYYVTAGDHDLWDSRNRGDAALTNFSQVFGDSIHDFSRSGIHFVILDNSDIYKGIDDADWQRLESLSAGPVSRFLPASARSSQKPVGSQKNSVELRAVGNPSTTATRLTFVFGHKTPFHPQSGHIMGEENEQVSRQARKLIDLLEQKRVDGFFCGDLHFFAQFNSPNNLVKMTTIGAVTDNPNFQGPRFVVVTVYSDYSWEVSDIEIQL